MASHEEREARAKLLAEFLKDLAREAADKISAPLQKIPCSCAENCLFSCGVYHTDFAGLIPLIH